MDHKFWILLDHLFQLHVNQALQVRIRRILQGRTTLHVLFALKLPEKFKQTQQTWRGLSAGYQIMDRGDPFLQEAIESTDGFDAELKDTTSALLVAGTAVRRSELLDDELIFLLTFLTPSQSLSPDMTEIAYRHSLRAVSIAPPEAG